MAVQDENTGKQRGLSAASTEASKTRTEAMVTDREQERKVVGYDAALPCEVCGLEDATVQIRTGVSVRVACEPCFDLYFDYAALRELPESIGDRLRRVKAWRLRVQEASA